MYNKIKSYMCVQIMKMRCVNATEVKYSMVRNSKENSTSKDTKSCIDTSRTGEQTLRR